MARKRRSQKQADTRLEKMLERMEAHRVKVHLSRPRKGNKDKRKG